MSQKENRITKARDRVRRVLRTEYIPHDWGQSCHFLPCTHTNYAAIVPRPPNKEKKRQETKPEFKKIMLVTRKARGGGGQPPSIKRLIHQLVKSSSFTKWRSYRSRTGPFCPSSSLAGTRSPPEMSLQHRPASFRFQDLGRSSPFFTLPWYTYVQGRVKLLFLYAASGHDENNGTGL